MAEAALSVPGIERVVFVPTGEPPHRSAGLAPAWVRYHLVQRAIAGNPRFGVWDVELTTPGPHYTANTVAKLAQPQIPLIIGQDALAALDSWKDPDVLKARAVFLLAPREPALPLPEGLTTIPLEMPLVGISATDIRHRLSAGRSIHYLVPKAVADYLQWNDVYKSSM
jgi:nicotinate-nucleotide adenylyltransferase